MSGHDSLCGCFDCIAYRAALVMRTCVVADPLAPHAWMTPGTPVEYQPSKHGRWYAAIVDEPPRMLGLLSPVVRLRDIEPDYSRDHHPGQDRRGVFAASVDCVRRRERGPLEQAAKKERPALRNEPARGAVPALEGGAAIPGTREGDASPVSRGALPGVGRVGAAAGVEGKAATEARVTTLTNENILAAALGLIFDEVGDACAAVEADTGGASGAAAGARECLRRIAAIREKTIKTSAPSSAHKGPMGDGEPPEPDIDPDKGASVSSPLSATSSSKAGPDSPEWVLAELREDFAELAGVLGLGGDPSVEEVVSRVRSLVQASSPTKLEDREPPAWNSPRRFWCDECASARGVDRAVETLRRETVDALVVFITGWGAYNGRRDTCAKLVRDLPRHPAWVGQGGS